MKDEDTVSVLAHTYLEKGSGASPSSGILGLVRSTTGVLQGEGRGRGGGGGDRYTLTH
jgi:hypothetical protein